MLIISSRILILHTMCYIFNFQKHIHCYNWCDFAVKCEIFWTKFDFDLILICDLDLRWPWDYNQTTGRPCISYKWHLIFDYTSSGSNVMHKSRLPMLAGRHFGFSWKSGIFHGEIYGDFQLWAGRVQTNWFQVRNPLLQFCPTSNVYLPD